MIHVPSKPNRAKLKYHLVVAKRNAPAIGSKVCKNEELGMSIFLTDFRMTKKKTMMEKNPNNAEGIRSPNVDTPNNFIENRRK